MSSRALISFSGGGFVASGRYGNTDAGTAGAGLPNPVAEGGAPSVDPIEEALARGFAEGEAKARAEFEAQIAGMDRDYLRLERGFAELACVESDRLSEKLRDTVIALCESAIMPAALDVELLQKRIESASSMLMRAQDERVIRLNPEDYKLVEGMVSEHLAIEPDPSLERGALRIETEDGGVRDGPESWRKAIAEALGQC